MEFLPRGRNDLNAERLLIRLPRRRQGEHRKADQRDDEGDGKIIDRRIEAHIVNPRHVANVIVPREDRRGRHDDKILARHQIAKASIDGRTPPLGGEIILRRKLPTRLNIPDNSWREFGSPIPQQSTIAVGNMGGPQRTKCFDGAATVGRNLFDIGDLRQRIANRSEARADFLRNRCDAEIRP